MREAAEARAQAVKEQALALGFDACGIARAGPADPQDELGAWLAQGYHADMDWLARTKSLRQDVLRHVPGAQSVVVTARNYYYPRPDACDGAGKVSRYAWGRDYHRVIRKLLKRLAAFIDGLDPEARSVVSVDSGPVLEGWWAVQAGVGWVGKNSLILREDLGSWFFLGVVITTVPLAADSPVPERCGSCSACIQACPAGAIVRPGTVDARRCIAYHTIENRGDIPEELHPCMGLWVFGCDLCQEVCPWNRSPVQTSEEQFQPRPGVANPDLAELGGMDAAAFERRFQGSAVRRARHSGIRRNACIALRNLADT